ncbi:MAG TPA: hypothetical protein PKY73_05280 [Hyphomonas sp.]|nr:hypothetical protein [Hyphomonas sp.]HRK66944.1 hypothetical protein [Hyphomonas sp.]
MKKYLIAAASLSVLGMASAHAQVFPSADGNNSAQIGQTGNNNRAEIDQAVGGVINGQNLAVIQQNGNRNDARVTQTSATSPMAAGFANDATITQTRARGLATIDQIHDYARTRVNTATIVQNTPDATANIDQRGDRLTAVVRQLNTSVAPVANVKQNGTFNTARVFQRGANGNVDIRQGTFSAGPGVSPDMSRGTVEVNNNGANAIIKVSQIGTGHIANVAENGLNGLIDISMEGQFNNASVIQESSNGTVRIFSSPSSFFNNVNVNQLTGDNGSTAFVSQGGSFATADIEQGPQLGLSGNNLADVIQTGSGVTATSIYSDILQSGANNTAFVNQAGSYAISGIFQYGAGHTANVSQ